jgi:hypothetical protein
MVAVLLLALWLRSFQLLDIIAGHLPWNPAVSITSAYGRIVVGTQNAAPPWKWHVHAAVLDGQNFGGGPKAPRSWFIVRSTPADTAIQVPHGFVVLLTAILAIMPWLPLRFSVRTLLICTTLVAVGLGLIVWLR